MARNGADAEAFVNTSVRVSVDLLARFNEVITAEDPETDFSKEVRRWMRRRIAEHDTARKAAA